MNDNKNEAAIKPLSYKYYRFSETVIARFVARRTVLTSAFLALIFGAFVASKSAGFAAAYPTQEARTALATSFGSNVGLTALLGVPRNIESITGFTVWNTLSGMIIIGAIWGIFIATKTFRGDEDSGRWELLLAGQTTSGWAAANALLGLGSSVVVLYAVVATTFVALGKIQTVNFDTNAALFFAFAAITATVEFIAVGALASQIMPTRGRALRLATIIFGICFLLRATADTTSSHWLINITPLGWIENMQPLYGPQPVWLLPPLVFVILISALTIFLANRRDLGGSVFADKDTSKPHIFLLSSPISAAVRLTRGSIFSWLVAIGLMAGLLGLLTKSAEEAFSQSNTIEKTLSRVAHAPPALGATIFLSIVFFLMMLLIMSYTASAVGAMREEEAEGYLDNLLVRPVSRLYWIWGRISLSAVVVVLAGLIGGTSAWAGEASQGGGISYHDLFFAGINTIAPAIFTLGVGIVGLGLVPRLTTVLAYGIIGWSFLIELVSSGLNLNELILDTSVLHHVSLAPASDANWGNDAILVALGLVLCVIGTAAFNKRDLQTI
jgi:ABC-2 type transport system permease protein